MAKDPAFLFYTSDFLTGTMLMNNEQKGKYITLLCLQHQLGRLNKNDVISTLGGIEDERILSKFIIDEEGKYYNKRLEEESKKRKAYTESRRNSRVKTPDSLTRIYLLYDETTKYHKIGNSVNPLRRYNELLNQVSPAILPDNKIRNYKLVWYSNEIEQVTEGVLHKEFSENHIMGEWFNLTTQQVKGITDRYEGTYVNRTSIRTENENEDIPIGNKGIIIQEQFKVFWDKYGKKTEREKCLSKFSKLKESDRDKILSVVDSYVLGTPDIKYRKNPSTWLNNKCWNDEISKPVKPNGGMVW